MTRITNKAAGAKADKGSHYEVIPFTVFEQALFDAAYAIEEHEFASDCSRTKIAELIRAEFKDVAPTFVQYRALQETMYMLGTIAAGGLGFTGQAVRKHVAVAIRTIYGALPVSAAPAAQAKAHARAIKAKIAKAAPAVGKDTLAGNVSGGTMPHRAGPAESIEQFIARVGIVATINALARILETDNATKLDAVTLRAIVSHVTPVAGVLKAA